MLTDLNEPWEVIGLSRQPIITPEDACAYEVDGFRGHVIFPGGFILEDDGSVKMYYGASDTFVALVTAKLDDLLAMIEPLA